MESKPPIIRKKKTLGKQKIAIKKIKKKTSLQVTFSKRRSGLFNKAAELCILCGAQIGILVQSPADKLFSFSHPSSLDALIHGFLNDEDSPLPVENCEGSREYRDLEMNRMRHAEASRQLDREKKRMKEVAAAGDQSELWWDNAMVEMELYELEEYATAVERLRENVVRRIEEMKTNETSSSRFTETAVPVQDAGLQPHDPNVYGTEEEIMGLGSEYFGDFPLCSLDYHPLPFDNCDNFTFLSPPI